VQQVQAQVLLVQAVVDSWQQAETVLLEPRLLVALVAMVEVEVVRGLAEVLLLEALAAMDLLFLGSTHDNICAH
jgi:hypothetical protein